METEPHHLSRRTFLGAISALGGAAIASTFLGAISTLGCAASASSGGSEKTAAHPIPMEEPAMLSEETLEVIAGVAQRNQATPPTVEEYLERWTKELDLIIHACRKEKLHKIDFRGNLFFGHEGFIPYMKLDILKAYATGLKDSGCSGIDMNFGLSPWLNEDKAGMEKHDGIVKFIREDLGCHLGINFSFNPGVKFRFPRFSDYLDAALKIYPAVALRYSPTPICIIHEPTTIGRRFGFNVTNTEWTDFTRRVAIAVKEASPSTQVIAGYVPGLEPDVEAAMLALEIPELDKITIDNYSLGGMERINNLVKLIKAAGKPTYIEETWRSPYIAPTDKVTSLEDWSSRGIGLDLFEPLDEKWAEMMAVFASAWGMETLVVFWTQTFFLYQKESGNALSRDYNVEVMKAILAGRRTKMSEFYKTLSEELGTVLA